MKLSSPPHSSRASWWLVGLLFAVIPLSFIPPVEWGWENGVLENLEVAAAAVGLVMALRFFSQAEHPMRMLGLSAAAIWVIAIAREFSWGAVFLEPLSMSAKGPYYSSSVLWYKPAVYPILGLLLLAAAVVFVRFGIGRLVWATFKRGRFPWIEAVVILAAGFGSEIVEGHLGLVTHPDARMQVLEECLELVCYIALAAAQ